MDRCLICHRKLRDEESITRKIGPTCFARLRKLTKEEKARKRAKAENKRRQQEVLRNQINMFETNLGEE